MYRTLCERKIANHRCFCGSPKCINASWRVIGRRRVGLSALPVTCRLARSQVLRFGVARYIFSGSKIFVFIVRLKQIFLGTAKSWRSQKILRGNATEFPRGYGPACRGLRAQQAAYFRCGQFFPNCHVITKRFSMLVNELFSNTLIDAFLCATVASCQLLRFVFALLQEQRDFRTWARTQPVFCLPDKQRNTTTFLLAKYACGMRDQESHAGFMQRSCFIVSVRKRTAGLVPVCTCQLFDKGNSCTKEYVWTCIIKGYYSGFSASWWSRRKPCLAGPDDL